MIAGGKQVHQRYFAQNTQLIAKVLTEDDELTARSLTNLLEETWPEVDTYLVSLNLFQLKLLSQLISIFFRLAPGIHFPFPLLMLRTNDYLLFSITEYRSLTQYYKFLQLTICNLPLPDLKTSNELKYLDYRFFHSCNFTCSHRISPFKCAGVYIVWVPS